MVRGVLELLFNTQKKEIAGLEPVPSTKEEAHSS